MSRKAPAAKVDALALALARGFVPTSSGEAGGVGRDDGPPDRVVSRVQDVGRYAAPRYD